MIMWYTPYLVDIRNMIMIKDPVCGSEVTEKNESMTFENKTYHFCCASCKWAFEKDPKQFIVKT